MEKIKVNDKEFVSYVNKDKEVIIQIFSGGFKENNVKYDEIEKKLNPLLEKIKISKVIMGWSLDKDIYLKTKELLNKYNVEYYLWIPVFSEIGLLKPANLLVDFNGKEIKSYSLQEGENFEFYCPNDPLNIKSFIEVYEENFSDIDFDGVFLDKIRYGSFSNSLNGVFNCFCPHCLNKYEKLGIDIGLIQTEMNKVANGEAGYNKEPLEIVEYNNGEYKFKNEIWEKYFHSKSQNVYEALQKLKVYFKEKNMKIGIDTFSPFMSYFSGQDMNKLKNIADFIKPMMYRITQAPAGLPFEYDNFIKETTNEEFNIVKSKFNKIIKCEDYNKNSFDINFVQKELNFMINLGVDIYAGIEINRKESIAEVYPDYIAENLAHLGETKIKGYVLSWDLLSAPEENIEEIIRHFIR